MHLNKNTGDEPKITLIISTVIMQREVGIWQIMAKECDGRGWQHCRTCCGSAFAKALALYALVVSTREGQRE
jgi:hypothetical protein